MTRASEGHGCKFYIIIPLLIIVVIAALNYVSYLILLEYVDVIIVYNVPLLICVVVASVYVIKHTIKELGGPREYFCGGYDILLYIVKGQYVRNNMKIIKTGPFSVTRHPVYSATLAILAALTLVIPAFILALVVVTMWLYLISTVEERMLEKIEDYLEYKRLVPRFNVVGITIWGCKNLVSSNNRGDREY